MDVNADKRLPLAGVHLWGIMHQFPISNQVMGWHIFKGGIWSCLLKVGVAQATMIKEAVKQVQLGRQFYSFYYFV